MTPTPVLIRGLQVLTLTLLLTPLMVGAYLLHQFHQRTKTEIADMTPRLARLQGMATQQQAFEDHAQLARNLVNAFVWPANVENTQLANESQQRIRTALEQSGLKLDGLQARDQGGDQGYLRTRVSLRFEGNLVQLQQALLALRAITPVLVHENLKINNEGPFNPATIQRLTGSMDILVLKARS